jgi:hypothetical protein
VKEDAASMFRCRDWRLTAQTRKVWGQKLREARARHWAAAP